MDGERWYLTPYSFRANEYDVTSLYGQSAIFALIRRVQVAAPTDTGDVQVVGIIGTGQPGVLQAETWVQEEETRANAQTS